MRDKPNIQIGWKERGDLEGKIREFQEERELQVGPTWGLPLTPPTHTLIHPKPVQGSGSEHPGAPSCRGKVSGLSIPLGHSRMPKVTLQKLRAEPGTLQGGDTHNCQIRFPSCPPLGADGSNDS